jgi:hypothetical protein
MRQSFLVGWVGRDRMGCGPCLLKLNRRPNVTAVFSNQPPLNPISEAERTEANEANEGQVNTRAAARTIGWQARGREIPSSFVLFVSFCEPNFGVRVETLKVVCLPGR